MAHAIDHDTGIIERPRHRVPDAQRTDLAVEEGAFVLHAVRRCVGAGLLMAALGIWLIPAEDAEAQMLKLVMSLSMLGGGLFLLSGLAKKRVVAGLPMFVSSRTKPDPRQKAVEFRHRKLQSASGFPRSRRKDRLITVRDAAGRPIVSMPLSGRSASSSKIRKPTKPI